MKRMRPGPIEVVVFVAMALVAAVIVGLSPNRGPMLFFVTFPVFLIAALMGSRRNPAMRTVVVDDSAPRQD